MSTFYLGDSTFDVKFGRFATSGFVATSFLTAFSWYLWSTYRRLKDVPGPFWARITDLQRMFVVKTGRSHEIHQKAHDKYGDMVRLGPNMVSVSDPNTIPAVYPMRPGFPKSKFYDAFVPYTKAGSLPAIFTTRDENLHKLLKSPIASLYSLSNVITLESFVDEVLGLLCCQLEKRFVDTHEVFDLADWLQYFSFEVMGVMTFSKKYGFLETGQDVDGMLATIWNFMLTVAPMTQAPWIDKLWHKNNVMANLKNQSGNSILKIAADNINDRKQRMKHDSGDEKLKQFNDRDFLSRFLEIESTNPSIPDWATTAWTFSNVIAGSDSTAVVMRTVLYNLLSHSNSLDRLYTELLDVEREKGLRRPYPKWNEVSELPYLDACVNEAIRLHPPFCLQLERIVPEGGITVCGRYLEEGTVVGMNPYVVNRHRPTFGEDADSWRPERWLEHGAEYRRKLEQSIMTFGAGRRVCLGKSVALLEIKKIVPALLLNYKFELLDPNSYVVENSYFFRQRGINVKARKHDSVK
ncbi:cytochrome P450 [Usnea florida]